MSGVRATTRTFLAGALGTVLLALAGCSGGDSGGSADEPAPSASGSASGGTEASPSPSASPTTAEPSTGSTAFPGVTPASGPEVAMSTFSVRAPEGWELDPQTISGQTLSASGQGASVQLVEQAGASDLPLEDQVDSYLASQFDDTETERLPDVTIGEPGVQALRFQWTQKGRSEVHQDVLTTRNGYSVTVLMTAAPGVLKRDPQLFDSILASLTWR